MAAKSKIIKSLFEVPEIAQRWFESLNFDEATKVEVLTPEYLKKLDNIGNEFPEGFRQYEPKVLHEAIDDAAKGHSDLAIINPSDYRNLASRSIEGGIDEELRWLADNPEGDLRLASPAEHLYRIDKYKDFFESGHKFDEIPFLQVDPEAKKELLASRSYYADMLPLFAQILRHQGRHRMRAQEELGAQKALLRVMPDQMLWGDKVMNVPAPRVSKVDPKRRLYSEGSSKPQKSIADTLKFLSLGALGGLYDGPE
jgi:hypothetical protein